ncbi:diphthamide biosynthesis protein 2 [Diaporthe amygdali]|uniref:diphthamide biosynthesis protein 2 n=1 Tax=Phomopsis amygdali TaxID=1214568 RepID=UPI0022FF2A4C|nr:diphthamide biosynthesis protein 2 [Diaporthe amygdali]KAJ0122677.1 diphthamide biosynthesis protein 2 [Diaporthe amygdali]
MTNELTAAPVLSTPDDHLFEYQEPVADAQSPRSDDELRETYEVARVAREIRHGAHRRIALQFPDHMLGDAPKVVTLLQDELDSIPQGEEKDDQKDIPQDRKQQEKIYILADTSYSSCCVDEIAAEHIDAHVVVHFGRSCLSPTSRLPVIYVFTKHTLNLDDALQSFESEFPDKESKLVLMADVTYQDHVPELYRRARDRGYTELLSTRIQHDPLGSIPNRIIVDPDDNQVKVGETDGIDLKQYSIFHISTPPTALLLALSSRVSSLHIFSTPGSPSSYYSPARTTRALLGRRYAKLLNLTTAGIIGILVNTLSVANYLSSIDAIRKQIAAAGKKSYTVVVGKLNSAKLANFAEMDGWVVVGCWESSLVEEDAGFYRPVLTPFELEVALMPDEERVWGLSWWGGIESVKAVEEKPEASGMGRSDDNVTADSGVDVDEDEDDVPVFDLRTGKLVSNARPMRVAARAARDAKREEATDSATSKQSDALTMRPKAELATINGVFSPGAEYLRSQRTWQGLGTDFEEEKSAAIEEGRSGVARGYTVGQDDERR